MTVTDRLTPGWRARIGLIYMHSSIVMESEFASMAPEGVTFHTTRIELTKPDIEGLTSLGESRNIEACTGLLVAAPLNVVIFGGTSASFIKGLGWDRKICERMRRHSNGVSTTTTSTASVNALRAVGAQRIGIATPYIDPVTERARVFFTENEFDVVDAKGLGLETDHEIGSATLGTVYQLVRSLQLNGAEAVFISCTNLQTIGVIPTLETDLGIPVISAIQASFWECLNLSGVAPSSVVGFGSLFEYR